MMCLACIATRQKASLVGPSTAENTPKSMKFGLLKISIGTPTSQLIKMGNISIVSQEPNSNSICIFIKDFLVLLLVLVNWAELFYCKSEAPRICIGT